MNIDFLMNKGSHFINNQLWFPAMDFSSLDFQVVGFHMCEGLKTNIDYGH
jgi:hypothetical protein